MQVPAYQLLRTPSAPPLEWAQNQMLLITFTTCLGAPHFVVTSGFQAPTLTCHPTPVSSLQSIRVSGPLQTRVRACHAPAHHLPAALPNSSPMPLPSPVLPLYLRHPGCFPCPEHLGPRRPPSYSFTPPRAQQLVSLPCTFRPASPGLPLCAALNTINPTNFFPYSCIVCLPEERKPYEAGDLVSFVPSSGGSSASAQAALRKGSLPVPGLLPAGLWPRGPSTTGGEATSCWCPRTCGMQARAFPAHYVFFPLRRPPRPTEVAFALLDSGYETTCFP